jgi:hypothetical protein
LDLNNPPTPVGGIQAILGIICWLDLNYPPTAVGGIQSVLTIILVGWI